MLKDYLKESKSGKAYRDFLTNAATGINTNISNPNNLIVGDKGDVKRSLEKRGSVRSNIPGAGQSFKQGDETVRYELDPASTVSEGNKRLYDRKRRRLEKRDKRRDDRAERVAIRKGMSKDQAKDFMSNRRARFNQMTKEYFKGLIGPEQNADNIEDRYYRKDGSGTIQNTKAADGTTYDATAPFQGEGPNYEGRGQNRKLIKDNYGKFFDRKIDKLPTIDKRNKFTYKPISGNNPTREKVDEKIKDKKDTIKLTLTDTPTNNFMKFLEPGTMISDVRNNQTTPGYNEPNQALQFKGPLNPFSFDPYGPSFMTPESQKERDERNKQFN